MMLLAVFSIILCQVLGGDTQVVENSASAAHPSVMNTDSGEISLIQMFPYLASVQTNKLHVCGGSILSEVVVLTAAHCVANYPPDVLSVQVGSTNLKYGGSKYGGSSHEVVAMEIHENYNDTGLLALNDVALLKVSPPFTFREKVSNVHLAVDCSSEVTPGIVASVAAWGQTNATGGEFSSRLRNTSLTIADGEICARTYGNESSTWMSSNGLFCAAAPYVRTCLGDSGGPLVVDGTQIGIMARSNSCAWPRQPRLYVDVAFHREWLKQHYDKLVPQKQAEVSLSLESGPLSEMLGLTKEFPHTYPF